MLSSVVGRISHLSFSRSVRHLSVLRVGVDEAGRGAVLGPMVISSVLLDSKEDEYFKKIGVKDSKELLPEKRSSLYSSILDRVSRSYSYHLSSLSIDKLRKQGLSMNRIEENHILNLLSRFLKDDVDEVIVDAFVSKKNRLDTEVQKLFPNSVVKCEFHADANHICVAAASIVAKVGAICSFRCVGGARSGYFAVVAGAGR